MATLYKPKIVTYRLKNGSYRTRSGKRVGPKTPGAIKTVTSSTFWYARYRDGKGQLVQVKLSESKETARRMLAKLTGDAELARVNLVDPFEDQRARDLKEHLEDFRRYLAARGNTAGYVKKTWHRAGLVIQGCKFRKIEDLQASAVVSFLAELRLPRPAPPLKLDRDRDWYTVNEAAALLEIDAEPLRHLARSGPLPGPAPDRSRRPMLLHCETLTALAERRALGLATSTSNDYLRSIKQFAKWLVKDRRAAVDPLAHLERQNAQADLRRHRRALPEETFHHFVETTASGRPFRDLAGSDRLVLYTLAANTGFRAKELASLSPASFALDASPPTVTVEAAFSKHRRKDVQPLRPDVADMMRQYAAGRPPRDPLWPGTWYRAGAEMVRIDLAAAEIPYEDDAGRTFDFHATRGQFISQLAAQGVHPKLAQQLARHSSITLTMDHYTHLDVLDMTGALDKLPALPTIPPASAAPPQQSERA